MDQFLLNVQTYGQGWFGMFWPIVWNLVKIVCLVLPIMGCVAYLTLWERKMIGWMHIRLGPNRVGPAGLLQPIADALKLLLKEIVVPPRQTRHLFVIAPVMTIMPSLAAWAVVPFGPDRRWQISMPDCCLPWRSRRWKCMESSLPAGRPTRNMHFWERCAHQLKWCRMKSRWVLCW